MIDNSDKIDELLTRLRQEDNSALESLYDLTNKQLYVLCYSYLRNRDDSEDALSETYLKLMENCRKFSGSSGFDWIYTIAVNICKNKLKKNKRIASYDFSDPNVSNKLGSKSISEMTVDDESGIIEISKKVLSKAEFSIVILHAVNNYKFKEIAKIHNMFENTARWKYNNAIKKIQREYTRKYSDD